MIELRYTLNGTLMRANASNAKQYGRMKGQRVRCTFSCSTQWARMAKVAVFKVFAKEIYVPIRNNSCEIPEEVLNWSSFSLSVVGQLSDTRLWTNTIKITQGG